MTVGMTWDTGVAQSLRRLTSVAVFEYEGLVPNPAVTRRTLKRHTERL
jgi:hypothetical protein